MNEKLVWKYSATMRRGGNCEGSVSVEYTLGTSEIIAQDDAFEAVEKDIERIYGPQASGDICKIDLQLDLQNGQKNPFE